MARLRHSCRTTNQSSPIPGVIFVSRTSDHVHGQRNPSTIAAASSRWMLPPASSISASTTPTASHRRPVRTMSAPSRINVQAAMNACHGRIRIGWRTCKKAGE
jgi:hypothetical protein